MIISERFRIVAASRAGGMGQVYRAQDVVLGRDVAVKTLPSGVTQQNPLRGRLEREARAASALNHPNIVSVYDFGQHAGMSYIVGEWVDGESLSDLIGRGKVPLRRAMEIGAQIAEGLAAAHSVGIIHRDLKPSNVMLTATGRVKIIDFGLAKQTHPLAPIAPNPEGTTQLMTTPGIVMGTIAYMSPEQVRGEPLDGRTDIFNLGIILYEMLSGKRPFSGTSSVEVMHAILKEDPLEKPAGLPPGVDSIIRRCLEKDVRRRFQNAADLAFALAGADTKSAALLAKLSRRRRIAMRATLFAIMAGTLSYWIASRNHARPVRIVARQTRPSPAVPQALLPLAPSSKPAVSPDATALAREPASAPKTPAYIQGEFAATAPAPARPMPPVVASTGHFETGDGDETPFMVRSIFELAPFQEEFDKYAKQGYRPIYVAGYDIGGPVHYTGIFEKAPNAPPRIAKGKMTSADYQSQVKQLRSQGYRPILVNACTVDDQPVFSAIWERTSDRVEWITRHNLSPEQLDSEIAKHASEGFHFTVLSGYADHGQSRYAAIWVKSANSDEWEARYGLTEDDWKREFKLRTAQGYRPAYLSVWPIGGQPYFAVIWKKSTNTPAWVEFHGMSYQGYVNTKNKYFGLGYRTIEMLGYLDHGQTRFAAIWAKIPNYDRW